MTTDIYDSIATLRARSDEHHPVPGRRRWTRAIAPVVAAVAAATFQTTMVGAISGTPETGNLNCADSTKEVRVEPVSDGTYSANGFSVTVDVQSSLLGQVFDFSNATGGVVTEVFVKGGTKTNLYSYSPGVTSGTGLHAAVNVKGDKKYFGLSHLSFCFNPVVDDQITLKKVDAVTGAPLAGATLELWKTAVGAGGTQIGADCVTGATGICTFTLTETGTYIGHEEAAPTGYLCCADDQSRSVTSDSNREAFELTFTNTRATGNVHILKTDDTGAALAGVNFALTGTSDLGTVVNADCTTDADGDCTISGIELGTYDIDETNLDTTRYAADADLPESVVIDLDGETVELAYENPRIFTKIVLVCFGDDLYSSNVAEGTGTAVPSLGGANLSDEQEAALCATTGARFEGNPTGNHQLNVAIS